MYHQSKGHRCRLCVIYRPPPSKINKFKNSIFFEEWSEFLDRVVVTSDALVIMGDLNFHIDDPRDTDAQKFLQTLSDHGLLQHVTGPTHVLGHTLDVIITRENSSVLSELSSICDLCIFDNKGNLTTDHLAVFTRLNTVKPPRKRETISFRKY